jgi:hypothetical protein
MNGQVVGRTPWTWEEARAGKHLLEIRAAGYKVFSSDISVAAQHTGSVHVVLVPLESKLVIHAPADASVYVDDELQASGGGNRFEVTVSPGRHGVVSIHPRQGKREAVVDCQVGGLCAVELDRKTRRR